MRVAGRFFLLSICFSFISFLSGNNQDLQQNIIFVNIQELNNLIHGNRDFAQMSNVRLTKNYENYFTPIQGQGKKYNVILVFAESFSTVDSQRAGGLYNNFPLFDKVQADGITFTNFMANGCTSETAHIALLQ